MGSRQLGRAQRGASVGGRRDTGALEVIELKRAVVIFFSASVSCFDSRRNKLSTSLTAQFNFLLLTFLFACFKLHVICAFSHK